MKFRLWLMAAAPMAVLAICVAPGIARAPQTSAVKNPVAGNPQAIRAGEANFRLNCAVCHGPSAAGGMRAPSLVSGRFLHGDSDAALFTTVLHGIPGTLMPASSDLSEDEVWEVIAYLRSLQPKAPPVVSGNPAAGERYFWGEGACYTCHMVRGRGGRLGPDLSRVGAARPREYLTDSIREPNKEISEALTEPNRDFPMLYDSVTVTLPGGEKITGIAKNEDTFSIQMMDERTNLRFFLKKDLKSVVHERKSLMPAYGTAELPEVKLQDLIAYLESLRGE